MAKPAKQNNPHIVSVVGTSGHGKSTWLMLLLKPSRRMLVWDPKDEYARTDRSVVRITSLEELRATLLACPDKNPGRYAFVPYSMKCFATWCECALDWGHADIVAEETADVTSPGKAPESWGKVIRRGGGVGLRVYGVTQRPSESDKTIFGNRTYVHCHALMRPGDRRYMANELGIDQSILDDLRGFDYIEVGKNGTIKRGTVKK